MKTVHFVAQTTVHLVIETATKENEAYSMFSSSPFQNEFHNFLNKSRYPLALTVIEALKAL